MRTSKRMPGTGRRSDRSVIHRRICGRATAPPPDDAKSGQKKETFPWSARSTSVGPITRRPTATPARAGDPLTLLITRHARNSSGSSRQKRQPQQASQSQHTKWPPQQQPKRDTRYPTTLLPKRSHPPRLQMLPGKRSQTSSWRTWQAPGKTDGRAAMDAPPEQEGRPPLHQATGGWETKAPTPSCGPRLASRPASTARKRAGEAGNSTHDRERSSERFGRACDRERTRRTPRQAGKTRTLTVGAAAGKRPRPRTPREVTAWPISIRGSRPGTTRPRAPTLRAAAVRRPRPLTAWASTRRAWSGRRPSPTLTTAKPRTVRGERARATATSTRANLTGPSPLIHPRATLRRAGLAGG